MVQSKFQHHRAQRTVIIGIGDMGMAVLRAFRQRLGERWDDLPTVACLAVVGKAVSAPDNDLSTVSLSIRPESVTRPEAREALRAAGPAVIATLVEALTRVSRISQRGFLQSREWSANRSEEVAFYVISALDDPLGGGVFLDLAYLARHLASQRLNTPAGLTGLLLLPDALNPDDPQPALARTYAALRELDAWMGAHNGYTAQWGDGVQIQGWGPAFDRGCYLMGALNAKGLGLETPGERIELAAEALLQLAVAPLAAGCESPLTPLWSTGERPHNYGALGLAAWVYPCRTLTKNLARRLAGEILVAWLGTDPDGSASRLSPRPEARPEGSTMSEPAMSTAEGTVKASGANATRLRGSSARQAEAFLAGCSLSPADIAEALLPAELLREAGLWRPLTPRLSLARAKRFRQDLEDDAAERLESLAARRSDLDHHAEAMGRELSERLAEVVAQRLNLAVPGRLPEVEALLTEVKQHLARLQVETEQAAEAHWKNLEGLDVQLERVGGEMDDLAARFPQLDWRAALAILLRPRLLLSLILAYRDLTRVGAAYGALLAQQMAVATEVLRRDLVVKLYERVLKDLKNKQVQVASLAGAIRAAHQVLAPGSETGRQGDGETGSKPKSSLDPWSAYSSLGFVLERSVLTPESVETLYALVRGAHSTSSEQALTELLADIAQAQGPLSAWLEKPDGEVIATACMDYARGRCRALYRVTVDELLMESLGDTHGRLEALRGLVELASPFLGWDETRLRGAEHQVVRTCAALGLGDGIASPLLEGFGDIPWAQVVATNEGRRVTALTVVRGLPLAALAGLEEYAAAYRVAEAKNLHADPDWADLPDPAEDVAPANSPLRPDEVLAEGFLPGSWEIKQSEEVDDDRRE